MTIYGRVAAGVVIETIYLADDLIPGEDIFTPDFAANLHVCDATVQAGWTYDGKTFAALAVVAPIPADLTAYAAAARYAKETAGITVGTAAIATDRESQSLITGMWAAAQINPNITVSFKSGSGFVTINAAQIAKIAAAVAGYVQACFTAEGQVVAGIAAGTIKATADVDKIIGAVTVPTS